MFRSSTIIRELVLSPAKVMLEHSVNYVQIGYVVVWQHFCNRKVFFYLPIYLHSIFILYIYSYIFY
jgi:hypothetical protein